MMDQNVYVAWIVAIDLAALVLATTAAKRMSKGLLRTTYFAFLATGILWVNLIFFVRYLPIPMDVAVILSRGIFIAILATLTAFGCFMIVFCGVQDELRSLRFLAFLGWNAVLATLSATGFVENGLKETDFGLAPVYGPFHPVLVISNFAWGAYIFWSAWRAFHTSQNSVFRHQLRLLFAYCLFTFLWAGTINGVLPVVFGSSRYSHVGPLGFLVLYLGIIRIVAEERNLFVERDLKALLQLENFNDHRNVFGLKQLFVAVEDMLAAGHGKVFRRGIQFAAPDGSPIEAEFLTDANHEVPLPLAMGHAQGLVQNMHLLEEHNRRMAFALIQAQATLRDPNIGKALQGTSAMLPQPLGGVYSWDEFRETIQRNRKEMIDTYGADVLCFSRGRLNTLLQVKSLAPSRLNTIFCGESGSGRGTFAHILHALRKGKLLEEIRCDAVDAALLKERLATLRTNADGLLLRDIDIYSADQINSLVPRLRTDMHLYFTACTGFPAATLAAQLHPRALSALTQVTVNVEPLRQNREELFYAIIDLTQRKLVELNKTSSGISKRLMDGLLNRSWPGNYDSLKAELEKLILWDSGPVLGSGELPGWLPAPSTPEEPVDSDDSNLTPLERAERKTILAHLKQNSFNQRLTSRELGIRPNTLILKMRKYGIKRPGRDADRPEGK